MNSADLTDEEINAACGGLVQNAAKVRYLQRMGLSVRIKPNGRPLVNRAHYDLVTGASAGPTKKAPMTEPNWAVV